MGSRSADLLIVLRGLERGGTQTRFVTLAEAVRDAGGRATLLASEGPFAARVRACADWRPVDWDSLSTAEARRRVALEATGCDGAVIALEPWSLPLVPTLARHVPVLLCVELRPGPERLTFGLLGGRTLGAELSELHATGRVRLVATAPDQARDHARALGLPPGAIGHVVNGVHPPAAVEPAGPPHSIVLLARLDHEKLPHVAAAAELTAAARAAGAPVTLALHGGGSRERTARRLLARQLPPEAWTLSGATYDAASVLHDAGVVVGTGRAATEALAAGRRVVVVKSVRDRRGQLGPVVSPVTFDAVAADNFSWRTGKPLAGADVWAAVAALSDDELATVRDRTREELSAQSMLAQVIAALGGSSAAPEADALKRLERRLDRRHLVPRGLDARLRRLDRGLARLRGQLD